MLFDLLVSSEDFVIAGLPIHLLDHPILLIDIHIPIVDSADLQTLEVGLGEALPFLIHEATDIKGGKHDLGERPILSEAEIFEREIDA